VNHLRAKAATHPARTNTHRASWRVPALAVLAAIVFAATPCSAKEPPASASWLDPLHYYRLVSQRIAQAHPPEFVEMLTAVARGSDMGPGDGWFHGSQSRYGWQWLAARFDANHDGSITRDEFTAAPDLFDRLDRNHDGMLTPADFDWSDRSLFAMQGMPSRFWFSAIDTDSNGRISREEWDAIFAKAAKGKGYLTPDDLREQFPVAPPPRPKGAAPSNDPSPLTLMKGLFSGELGSMFEGPDLGRMAPDFTLKTQDGKKQIRLSQFRGKKPVVLVFGSFT
jgi:hypothetical protein